jgi:hypothetical protein
VLLLLLGVGGAFWIRSVRDRKWSALLARVEQLSGEVVPRPSGHESLGRPQVPGNAWDDYCQVFPGRPTESIAGKITPYLLAQPFAKRADIESLLAKHAASIDLLSRGARRSDALPPARMTHNWQDSHALFLARARLLAEAGEIPEALDLLLDACVHARDIAQCGESAAGFTGHHLLLATFRELRDFLQARDVALQDLRTLEQRLQILDERFPGPGRDVELDLLELGRLLVQEDRDGQSYRDVNGRHRRSWRSFYSSRLQAASTFSEADRLAQRALQARRLPWAEEGETLRQAGWELQDFSDQLLTYSLPHLQVSRYAHQSRAALRLLRMAAHYRATGETLELEDPHGGRIQFTQVEGCLLAWHQSILVAPGSIPKKGSGDYWTTAMIEVRRR